MLTRTEELEIEIEKHNHNYWQLGEPTISDPEYDLLMEELKLHAPMHKLLSFVGGRETSRKKVTHEVPMMSLGKYYTGEEVLVWADVVARGPEEEFYVGPKFDGISVDKTGEVLATKKEDISDKLTHINSAPTKDDRGEVVVLKSVTLPKKYKTTLSAASGILATMEQEHSNLLTYFSFTSNRDKCTLAELHDIDWLGQMELTKNQDYPTDGLVISLVDLEYGKTLGGTDHHPNHSIALKYGNPTGITKLVDVIWQVGKRKITPVGIVEPVEIEGYTNTRISLHNFDETEKLLIGDTVEIMRCGQIIPQFKRVIKTSKKSKDINLENCPACGTKVKYDAPNLICPNEDCGGMKAKTIHDSLVRLGVENVGPSTVSSLVSLEFVDQLEDVFELDIQAWLGLPGFGEKKAAQKFDALKLVRATGVEDFKLLAALNIEGVGLSLSKKICGKMSLIEIELCGDFTGLDGIGGITSDKLVSDLEKKFGLLRWMKLNFKIKETKGLADRPLVVFTGKSETPRDEWVKIAAEKGYQFHKNVNKKVALVVTNDVNTTSSKGVKARQYGIKIINYDDFKENF